jgi:predicted patatin/cPLA2 family phospholipase
MDEPYWSADHPVVRLMRDRRDTGSRADGAKLGLAIQGGGMRGVVSGAMLTALDDLGFRDVFDAIYGSSSGALNGAYFYGGESWRKLPIYWDDLTTPRFVDLRRALNGDVLDLDYAFDVVAGHLRPLDYDAVLTSAVPLHVAVTLVDEVRTEAVSAFTSKSDLRAALRASAWLPLAVRGTAEFRGRRALDGALLTVHPFRLALADGCTHVLSLSTRPAGALSRFPSVLRHATTWYLRRISPDLGRAHRRAVRDYHLDRTRLATENRHSPRPPHILDVAPLPETRELSPLELDRGRLLLAARDAYELTCCVMGNGDVAALRAGEFRAIPRFIATKDGRGRDDA